MVERHGAVIMVTEREAQSYDRGQKKIRHDIASHGSFDLPNSCAQICCCPPARDEVEQTTCKKRDNCQRDNFRLEWPPYRKPNVVFWED